MKNLHSINESIKNYLPKLKLYVTEKSAVPAYKARFVHMPSFITGNNKLRCIQFSALETLLQELLPIPSSEI